jgi:hypothetical protein
MWAGVLHLCGSAPGERQSQRGAGQTDNAIDASDQSLQVWPAHRAGHHMHPIF